MKKKTLASVLLATTVMSSLSGCAWLKKLGMTETDSKAVIAKINEGKMDEAMALAKDESFYGKKEVLRHFQLGRMYYMNNQFYSALKEFEGAQKIVEDKALQKGDTAGAILGGLQDIGNAMAGAYYDVTDENKAMLYFYLALTNFRLYNEGKQEAYVDAEGKEVPAKTYSEEERTALLAATRAHMKNWAAFLNKDDQVRKEILEGTFGSFAYFQGNSADVQTGERLLSDIRDMLTAMPYPSSVASRNAAAAYVDGNLEKTPNIEVVAQRGLVEPIRVQRLFRPYDGPAPTDPLFAPGYMKKIFGSSNRADWTVNFAYTYVNKPEVVPADSKIVIKDDKAVVAEKRLAVTAPLSEMQYKKIGGKKSENEEKRIMDKMVKKCSEKVMLAYLGYVALEKKRIEQAAKEANDLAAKKKTKKKLQNLGKAAVKDMGYQAAMAALIGEVRSACKDENTYDISWDLLPASVSEAGFSLANGKYTATYSAGKKDVAKKEFEVKDGEPVVLDFSIPVIK